MELGIIRTAEKFLQVKIVSNSLRNRDSLKGKLYLNSLSRKLSQLFSRWRN